MKVITKTRIGAYGIIIKDNKIALVKKAGGGYKGKLDLPGGGIKHTELPEEALKREIMEEVGVEVSSYNLLEVTSTNIKWEIEPDLWEDLHHIGILYNVTITSNSLKQEADGLDSLGANWYDINDLTKDILSPFTIYALEKLGYKLK